MDQDLEGLIEEVAICWLQKATPELLLFIRTLVKKGFSADEIVEIIVERSGQPRDLYLFTLAGCAAEYLINNPEPATEIPQ